MYVSVKLVQHLLNSFRVIESHSPEKLFYPPRNPVIHVDHQAPVYTDPMLITFYFSPQSHKLILGVVRVWDVGGKQSTRERPK